MSKELSDKLDGTYCRKVRFQKSCLLNQSIAVQLIGLHLSTYSFICFCKRRYFKLKRKGQIETQKNVSVPISADLPTILNLSWFSSPSSSESLHAHNSVYLFRYYLRH
jgi:hypothetical protein